MCGCVHRNPTVNMQGQPISSEPCIYSISQLQSILTELQLQGSSQSYIAVVKAAIKIFPVCKYHPFIESVIEG